MSSLTFAQDSESLIRFESDIKPILESNCVHCHGQDEQEGGYRIDNREDAMDYIEPGDADGSDLFQYLISEEEDEMMPPPDDGGPLDDSDIKMIKTWINEGAVWPEGIQLSEVAESNESEAEPSESASTSTNEEAGKKSTDDQAAEVDRKKPNVYRAIGLLHPATLHLPMGLLLAAGLFAFLSLRGNFVMSDCAYYCLWLGTLGAIVACVTGWWFVMDQYPKELVSDFEGLKNMDHKVFWHRTSALVATVFALLLALFAASARNRDPEDGVAWKLGVILLAAGIGFVGHQGGKLTWKASHYDELFEVVDEYFPGINAAGEKEASDSDQNSTETDVQLEDGDVET